MHRKKVNISSVMVGQRVALKGVCDAIWFVRFIHYDLGYICLEQRTAGYRQPARREVETYVCGTFRYLRVRSGPEPFENRPRPVT